MIDILCCASPRNIQEEKLPRGPSLTPSSAANSMGAQFKEHLGCSLFVPLKVAKTELVAHYIPKLPSSNPRISEAQLQTGFK